MNLREVMTREVETTMPSTTLQQAALRMSDLNVGALPVCENLVPIGIVSDRDIVVRGVAAGMDARSTPVRAVMCTGVACVRDDASLDDVAQAMIHRQARRVLVLDAQGRITGIVTLGDLASAAASHDLALLILERLSASCADVLGDASRPGGFP